MPEAISDSSTLIHMAGIGRLGILKEFYTEILITPAVWKEVVVEGKSRRGVSEVKEACNSGWMKVITPANETVIMLLELANDRDHRDFDPRQVGGQGSIASRGIG